MINQKYKQMSQNERAVHRDMDAVHSYMEDIHNDEEFEKIYTELCEQYDVDGPGQIPHK